MFKEYLKIVFLSLLPVSELRGAIPYGFFTGMNMYAVFALSVISNALVPLFGYVFIDTVHRLLLNIPIYKTLFDKIVIRSRNKVQDNVNKYGMIGLMLFVAVPLPVTGAWTGLIGAWVLDLDRKKSCMFIALGVLIAGMIVTTVLLTGAGIQRIFIKTI